MESKIDYQYRDDAEGKVVEDEPQVEDVIIPETEDVGGLDSEGGLKEPEIVEKEPVKAEEIFVSPPVVRKVNGEPKVVYNKNGTIRRKRVYTEEQKEKMRERMKEVRKMRGKNKKIKDEIKAKDQKHKELKAKMKDIEIKEMEEKLSGKIAQEPAPKPQVIHQTYSKDDLKQIQLDAIVEYEGLRKKRKAKKKEAQQVAEAKQELRKSIQKELNFWENAGCY